MTRRSPHRSAPHPRSLTVLPTRERLTVEKLVAGGAGFGRRDDGEPVFIRGALPGDAVEIRELVVHKGYSDARTWHIVSPSPNRRPAPCEYANRCGGCDLMSLTPEAQRRIKHELIIEVLRRTAHIDASTASHTPLTWDTTHDAQTLGYRSRIRLHIGQDGSLGFLAAQSHVVVPVARCLVASDRVNQVLALLVELADLEPERLQRHEQVEVRVLGDTADLTWVPRASVGGRERTDLRDQVTRLAESLHDRLPGDAPYHVLADEAPSRWRHFVQGVELQAPVDVQTADTDRPVQDSRVAASQRTSEHALTGHELTGESAPPRLWFAPGTFTQVNWAVNQAIIRDLLDGVRHREARQFLDLYCGAGNFSLPLLGAGLDGLGVEANPTSIAVARAASHHQKLGGEFWASDVERAVIGLIEARRAFDLVLLDPPRAGFKSVAPLLRRLGPKHVFVCACDPVNFARDLKCLTENGFTLRALKAYDMFPQTHHVECTAWLESVP